MVKWHRKHIIILVFIILYFFGNLTFLEQFPFVHSDETWLGGLSRYILQTGDVHRTEPFFDLFERHPHALRLVFVSVQMLFIKLFGHSVFTLRCVSLLFACGSLFLVYRLVREMDGSERAALFSAFILGSSIQFLYAGHFARQESVLLFLHLFSLFLFYRAENTGLQRYHLFSGICIAAGTGVHPNSFILFLPLLFLHSYRIAAEFRAAAAGKGAFRGLIFFLLPAAAGAAVFTGLSFSLDPHFAKHYFAYGSTLGVDNSLFVKIRGVYDYFYKLFFQVSGTYYTPYIRPELVVFCIAGVTGFGFLFASKHPRAVQLALVLTAVCSGIILIGRYNQTSVIFLFPAGVLLTVRMVQILFRKKAVYTAVLAALLLAALLSSALQVRSWAGKNHYRNYLSNISLFVPKDAVVLANVNAEPYFQPGNLYDYRNLTRLPEHRMSFGEYVDTRNIEYILLPEEMEVIYNSRPVWNIIYGNIWPYYEDMMGYLKENAVYKGEFAAPVYAMRIVRYQRDRQWKVRVYRVSESE